ncbi:MAG: pentapeptide repeat-containing protein [Dechloromonas sp.]|nr:pentapeptide repeat-containing protein [Candidatus Dechloromonas phosphoritropha]MBP6707976.1 pentapeptide repeat-containing protein [Accumulibacter sp.]MBP8786711.1 pentapeptide repeat-containing protein [Azonexus sp.]MBP9227367.1 pentapeptide repeat-containing protein [Azonexus sp.]
MPQATTDLSRFDFSRKKLAGRDWRGAWLIGADLSAADLTGAGMKQADFTDAKLRATRRKSTTLRHAIFSRRTYGVADLANADVWNASFDKTINMTDSAHEGLVEPFVARNRK